MPAAKPSTFKRYCKTLTLEDDPKRIEQYEKVHQEMWPEIPEGMKKVGILDMEIYIQGNRLFMIMDTVRDFDHKTAMNKLARQPKQAEWEAYVSQFQRTSEDASADDKWQLMECIFKMSEPTEKHAAIDGQAEKCPEV